MNEISIFFKIFPWHSTYLLHWVFHLSKHHLKFLFWYVVELGHCIFLMSSMSSNLLSQKGIFIILRNKEKYHRAKSGQYERCCTCTILCFTINCWTSWIECASGVKQVSGRVKDDQIILFGEGLIFLVNYTHFIKKYCKQHFDLASIFGDNRNFHTDDWALVPGLYPYPHDLVTCYDEFQNVCTSLCKLNKSVIMVIWNSYSGVRNHKINLVHSQRFCKNGLTWPCENSNHIIKLSDSQS